MVGFNMVKIKKGGDGYFISDYLYSKERTRGNKTYLKCLEWKREFCSARAFVVGGDATITNDVHNHDVPDIKDYELRVSLKLAVLDPRNSRTSTPKIFESVRNNLLAQEEDEDQRADLENRLSTFRDVRGSMEHARASLFPPNPLNRKSSKR